MPTTAVVASMAAAYLVQEALFLLHAGHSAQKEGLAYSEKLTINLKPYETAVFALSRSPDCLAHETLEPIEVRPESPDALTIVDLLDWAGCPDGIVELGFDLVTEMRCAACGACEPILSPVGRCDDRLMQCPECGADSRSPESVSWLDADHLLSRTALSELGVPDHQILCVNQNGVRRYYQLGGGAPWEGWRPRTKSECLA